MDLSIYINGRNLLHHDKGYIFEDFFVARKEFFFVLQSFSDSYIVPLSRPTILWSEKIYIGKLNLKIFGLQSNML